MAQALIDEQVAVRVDSQPVAGLENGDRGGLLDEGGAGDRVAGAQVVAVVDRHGCEPPMNQTLRSVRGSRLCGRRLEAR